MTRHLIFSHFGAQLFRRVSSATVSPDLQLAVSGAQFVQQIPESPAMSGVTASTTTRNHMTHRSAVVSATRTLGRAATSVESDCMTTALSSGMKFSETEC